MLWDGTTLPPDDLKKAWRDFRRTHKNPRSEPARKLLLHYLHLVKIIAAKIFGRGKPPTLDFDDLASAGLDGLYAALQRFDPARRVTFETYAPGRIRGAILDSLRENDHLPRLRRYRSYQLENATNAAAQKYGRPPTDLEVAHELRIPLRDLAKFQADAQAYTLASLNAPKHSQHPGHGDYRLLELLHASPNPNTVEAAELRKYLLDGLPKNSRLVLILYYFEKLTMKEIAAVLNISESRVSQLHTAIIIHLQDRLTSPHTDDNLPRSTPPPTPATVKKPKPKK